MARRVAVIGVGNTPYTSVKKEVREMGYGYKEMLGAWRPDPESSVELEYSLFIPEMGENDAVSLGQKYNQYAVIYGNGEEIILDFLGNEPNKVFNNMETDYEEAWISWSEYKRHKYRFASVEWLLPIPAVPTSWMEAQRLQMFLNPKQYYKDLAPQFKKVEAEMEETFWSSKYVYP